LRLDKSKLPVNQNVHITNGDFPLAWAKMYGKGRVFYASFAHDAKTWDDPDIYQMYFEAIKWALKLTDADVTPRPFSGATQPEAK
jgi:type 1 glutamine amidotransferase